jgi:uncharacterized membrane protein YphA (DoxX/SURF4 family)
MAFMLSGNPQARGLAVLRIFLGVFFIFEALGKRAWLFDTAPLNTMLHTWLQGARPESRWYLETVCIPAVAIFARVVPLGEAAAGLALITGTFARLAAFMALLMVLNFHVASAAIFNYSFLTNGFGLPVMGGLLALALGGVGLPFSITKK